MTDIINLLPDSIANQIAAGEVIQRPASVVKELIENALDAGATRVSLETMRAGKDLIRVTDNGKGMSSTDARMAFERHATSKITCIEDLFSLTTMGFRGEALASVAAVAQVDLLTRTVAEEVGTKLCIRASVLESEEPATAAVGSMFSVRNLFFNVPARRKFLKQDETELRNVLNEVERIALVYPDISFSVANDGKLIQELPSAPRKARIGDVIGKRVERELIPIAIDCDLCEIKGYIGKPDSARRRGAKQFLFVNGRYMRHPYFHKAILSAYEQILPPAEQPHYFVYINIDPAAIDVNIHPTKTEIKFADEQAIFKILGSLTREGLASAHAIPTIDFNRHDIIEIPAYSGSKQSIPEPEVCVDRHYNPFREDSNPSAPDRSSLAGNLRPEIPWSDLFKQFRAKQSRAVSSRSCIFGAEEPDLFDADSVEAPVPNHPSSELLSVNAGNAVSQQPIQCASERPSEVASGYVYKGRYIVTALSRGLALIDFHRADIRVIFDAVVADYHQRRIPRQQCLFPEYLTFSPGENALLAPITDLLKDCGFVLTPAGDCTYALEAAPVAMFDEAADIVQDVVALFREEADYNDLRRYLTEQIALAAARRKARPYGSLLDGREINLLLARLFASSESVFTPDGKLIISIIEEADIFNRFQG